MNKRIIILVILVILVAAAVFAFRSRNSEPSDRILLSGNIELNEVDVAFKVAGKLIERNFNEGDRVQKGAVVARLDREQLLRQREQAVAALAMAEAQLAQSRTGAQWQKQSLAADIEQRRADLGSMQARLRELKTDGNELLLKTNMGAGHGGKSGRFQSLHETAEEFAFILWQLGVEA